MSVLHRATEAEAPKADRGRNPLRVEARLLLGLIAPVAGTWAFFELADDVHDGETIGLDKTVLLAFRRAGDLGTPIGPHWLQETARDFTALGGFTVLTVTVVVATILMLIHGRRLQALIFALTVALSQGLAELIKSVIGRARPDLVPQHDLVYSASFPSGHAMMAPVVYLSLAAIVAAGERSVGAKATLILGAVILIIAIGVSRVYLGVHWPSDVLAGWTLGAVIAIVAIAALCRLAPNAGRTLPLGGPCNDEA